MLDGTCTVTFNMLMIVLGSIAVALLISRYKIAFMIGYFFSMYWAYTLNQNYLLEVFGKQAFLWSSVFTFGFATLIWVISNIVQEGN